MEFGYARVYEEEWKSGQMPGTMLEYIVNERFLFRDIRNKQFERKNYQYLRNMLHPGDVLYLDALDSLGRSYQEIVQEWKALTEELQVDVIVLDAPIRIDSRWYRKMGETGHLLEEQMLNILLYMAEIQQRRTHDNQKEGIAAAKKAGKRFGRPNVSWDMALFDATAERWARGEITLEEACRIVGSSRSSWYNYARERAFLQKRQDFLKAQREQKKGQNEISE